MSRPLRRRRGMSLLEVMVATAMLLASVMALSRVAFLARKHAHGAEDRSMAQIFCQNIMEEVAAGVRPLSSTSPETFEGDEWIYSIDVTEADSIGLAAVTVTVERVEEADQQLPSEDQMGGYQLVRWIRTGDRSLESDVTAPDSEDAFQNTMDDPGTDTEPPVPEL